MDVERTRSLELSFNLRPRRHCGIIAAAVIWVTGYTQMMIAHDPRFGEFLLPYHFIVRSSNAKQLFYWNDHFHLHLRLGPSSTGEYFHMQSAL